MTDIECRIDGQAGRITLNRPQALNALTWDMCLEIEKALDAWAVDPAVTLLIIDGLPCEKAFCAGGDLAEMHRSGSAGDFDYGRRFWRDEYRMNAKLFNFPKPVVTFLHGFVMGGGVGVGCHGSHRITCDSTRIAMPECKVGLVPDIGGSLILARAPGRMGEYLGVTAARMGPGDAIYAGFADYYIPFDQWDALIKTLSKTGDWEAIDRAAAPIPNAPLAARQTEIDAAFRGETLRDVANALVIDGSEFSKKTLELMRKTSPIAIACTIELIHRVRSLDTIEGALGMEYRFTHRAMEHGDFIEGIRALIIDKDNTPNWRHADMTSVPAMHVSAMLLPLGEAALDLTTPGELS